MIAQKEGRMDFVLIGFSQAAGVRRFSFNRIEADRSRTPFTITADLRMLRTVGITVQELPLMCRRLLESTSGEGESRVIEFTEQQLRNHAAETAALSKPRTKNKPPVGAASFLHTHPSYRS